MWDRLFGELVLLAIVTPVIAAPATVFLLILFRRSVVRGMRRTVAASPAGAVPSGAPIAPAVPTAPQPASRVTLAEARTRTSRAALVYLAAGAAFSLVFTEAMLIQFQRATPLLVWFTASLVVMPILLALWVVLPAGRMRTIATVVWGVFVAGALIVLCALNPDIWRGIVDIWTDNNAVATLLIVAFMHRRIRAAGPLVLLLSAAAVIGGSLLLDAVEFSPAMFVVAAKIAGVFGSVRSSWVLLTVFGAVAGVVIAVPVLLVLGHAYTRKHLSDQSLTVGTVFLWFSLAYAVQLAPEGPAWLLTGVIAFAVYQLVTTVGFWAMRRSSHAARTDLLLLRPFSLGVRSERLFDHLGKVWLRVGCVHMIAGPDLVRSTVSPPELLSFLGRRLPRRFIHDERSLAEHLNAIDLAPDPDGRYRINQLFCGDDVWQQAMSALAALGTPVLMDLRGFTRANQGCTYEIEHLVRNVPLGRIVFAVDSTTERPYLEHVEERIWQYLPSGSPNLAYGGFGTRLVYVDGSAAGRERLLRALLECTT